MNIRYITIERQYGSGATAIARETARRCGVRCYGREIMEMVSREQDISLRELEEYEERVSGSLLYTLFVMSQSQTGDPDLVSKEAKLYVAEQQKIRELSKDGPAIFVGHCASQALAGEPGVLRVFIWGTEQDRHNRARTEYGIPPEQVEAVCRRFDRRRANYFHFCTRSRWTDRENYDLMLSSSALGSEACIQILTGLMK